MTKINSNYRERRQKILSFLKEAGSWKISSAVVKELAKEFDVKERQIYRDIKKVIQSFPKPNVDEVGRMFLISYESAISKALEIMRNKDPEISAKGVRLYFDSVESYTKFSHQYGLKEEVPQKHELTGKIFEIIKPEGLGDENKENAK